MKKRKTVACVIISASLLCACAAGQEGKTDLDSIRQESTEMTETASEEIAVSDNAQTAGVQNSEDKETTRNKQDTKTAVKMQGLLQGKLGGVGLGFLAYTLPQQDSEDYKLCFFKEGSAAVNFENSIVETMYYPLEMADYIFPDVRENNAPIGKFIEIYFFDSVAIGEEGAAGLVVVASYDVHGEICYDTRIYRWDGSSYQTEEKRIQEFNEEYRNAEDYPVEKLYHLSAVKGAAMWI